MFKNANKRDGKPFFGLGNWTRANAEICVLGFRGKLKRQSNKVSQVVLSAIREHSRKPDIVRNKIIELVGNMPKIELFARKRFEGWDSWGNELENMEQKKLKWDL